jgi:hypothetical protein
MGVAASAATLLLSSAAFAGPLMNQLGYAPEAEKQVVYPGSDANGLEVRDLNGKTVLKLFDLAPSAGRIQLQSECHGIEYRNITIEPIAPKTQEKE